ncbi:MAG TPA: S41 family peptidase [Ktedonobacterales bacterium]
MLSELEPTPAHSPTPPTTADPATRRRNAADGALWQMVTTSLLVIIAFTAGWFGNVYVNQGRYISSPDELLIHQAWVEINDNFVVTSRINQKKMAYAAINAMVGTLNDTGHTRFETPEEYAQENQQILNQGIVGIGVSLVGGGATPITIREVFPDSAAAKGGLKPGDEIVSVDGKSIKGYTIEQARPLIIGKAGTQVQLGIIRPGVSRTKVVLYTLTRAEFVVPVVTPFYIPGTTLVDIQVSDFSREADTQLRAALNQAKSKGVTGIILDLRGNPGGYLSEAEAVASEFIPAGDNKNVLIVKSRTSSQTYPVLTGGLATSTPLVVLVDGDTASAAEITTGAIKVNRPEVHVVGQTTFGTGTVLQTYLLADGSALVLGTSEFFLPDGSSIYGKGFKPDTLVKLPNGVIPLSSLAASESELTQKQLIAANDTQLLTAITQLDPTGPYALPVVKPAA